MGSIVFQTCEVKMCFHSTNARLEYMAKETIYFSMCHVGRGFPPQVRLCLAVSTKLVCIGIGPASERRCVGVGAEFMCFWGVLRWRTDTVQRGFIHCG